MTPSEKIATAKRLIREATFSIRRHARVKCAAEKCGCGHRRDQHTVTYSVNYTGGFCMATGCKCKWFMQREAHP